MTLYVRTLPRKRAYLILGGVAWPRLSETLTGPRHPDHCQNCGRTRAEIVAASQRLETWQECAQDTGECEPIFLNLCTKCNKETEPGAYREGIRQKRAFGMIARHPRFYQLLPTHVPQPGVMRLCIDCAWRYGMHCSHPETTANGGGRGEVEVEVGSGTLLIEFPQPFTYSLKASSASGVYTNYPGPPTSCSGREDVEEAYA